MDERISLNRDPGNQGIQQLQRENLYMEPSENQEQQMQVSFAEGVRCPHCGTALEPDADFCENCQHYIKKEVCSFCGAPIADNDAFCPECGSPRGGIVCPVCHTLNDFSFCKKCGTPLTEEARELVMQVSELPESQELKQLVAELQQLEMSMPYASDRDLLHDQRNSRLRERVLALLAQDEGVANPIVQASGNQRMSQAEHEARKEKCENLIAVILEKMAQVPQPKPAQARNYAMACRPQGVRLAWECNFKHALHSSPCGCAKPQMGGKWVVLGKNSKRDIKDEM